MFNYQNHFYFHPTYSPLDIIKIKIPHPIDSITVLTRTKTIRLRFDPLRIVTTVQLIQ